MTGWQLPDSAGSPPFMAAAATIAPTFPAGSQGAVMDAAAWGTEKLKGGARSAFMGQDAIMVARKLAYMPASQHLSRTGTPRVTRTQMPWFLPLPAEFLGAVHGEMHRGGCGRLLEVVCTTETQAAAAPKARDGLTAAAH